jgi:hypothetical protein
MIGITYIAITETTTHLYNINVTIPPDKFLKNIYLKAG